PAVVIGQPEVAKIDHWLETVASAGLECPIPQGPVVATERRFGESPRHAVAPHPYAQPGDIGEVPVEMMEVPAGAVLV
ncbi:hypothetical protein D6U74_19075, partial [Vibrio cholerae]|nr:hypothetical protein [Vibrio cholerae]